MLITSLHVGVVIVLMLGGLGLAWIAWRFACRIDRWAVARLFDENIPSLILSYLARGLAAMLMAATWLLPPTISVIAMSEWGMISNVSGMVLFLVLSGATWLILDCTTNDENRRLQA